MRRWLLSIIMVVLLVACGPSATPDGTPVGDSGPEEPRPVDTTTPGAAGLQATVTPQSPAATPEPIELDFDPFEGLEATATAQALNPVTPTPSPMPTREQVLSAEGVNAAQTTAEAAQVRERDWVRGASAADASVNIIVYADFPCGSCARLATTLKDLVDDYPDDVRVVYRHYPLTLIHDNAIMAAQAAEAAGALGSFWSYHDALYARHDELLNASRDETRRVLLDVADEVGVDAAEIEAALDEGRHRPYVKMLETEAINLRFGGTPSLIVNGEPVSGLGVPYESDVWQGYVAQQLAVREAEVRLEALAERQYDAPPPMDVDVEQTYLATVEMASGATFVIELLTASAPQTVNSFIFLAEEGWFDGVSFHRVLPGFVAQTGDPSGTGRGGPGYMLPNEIDPALSHDAAGVVAMANSGPDTNGSQWYITLAPATHLDGSYTIFGRVVEGLEVVLALSPRDPSRDFALPPGDLIERITIAGR